MSGGDSYVVEEMQSTGDKIDLKLLRHDYRGMYQVTGDMDVLTAAAQLRSADRILLRHMIDSICAAS